MNDVFNFKRFGKYLGAEISRYAAEYGLSLLILCLLGLIIYVIHGFFGIMSGSGWRSLGIGWRIASFSCSMLIIVCSMPIRCYGGLTEKHSGSSWLLVPASTMEKFLSMLLVCIILIPVSFLVSFLCIDWLLCRLDPGCGISLISWKHNTLGILHGLPVMDISDFAVLGAMEGISASFDDMLKGLLLFLLGGIFFKEHKIAKTILSLIAIGIAVSIFWASAVAVIIRDVNDVVQAISENIENLKWLSASLDCLECVVMAAAIYLRVRTLKH